MKDIKLIYQDRVYQDEWENGKDVIKWGKFDNEAVNSLMGNTPETPSMKRKFIFWSCYLTSSMRQSIAASDANSIIEKLIDYDKSKA